jgi:hypothetical protein
VVYTLSQDGERSKGPCLGELSSGRRSAGDQFSAGCYFSPNVVVLPSRRESQLRRESARNLSTSWLWPLPAYIGMSNCEC